MDIEDKILACYGNLKIPSIAKVLKIPYTKVYYTLSKSGVLDEIKTK